MAAFRDLPVVKVLPILLPTFNSVEIRCLALRKGEQYDNIAATIFFGYESPDAVKSGLDTWRRQVRADLLEREGLRLFVEVRPAGDINTILDDLQQGFLIVNGGAIKVALNPKTSTILDKSLYRTSPTRAFTGFNWFGVHVNLDESIIKRLSSANVVPSRLGVNNLRDLGPTFLGADILETSSELMVFAPVYMHLLWPPTLENRQMTWKVHGHRDLLLKTRFWILRTLGEPNGPVIERLELASPAPGEKLCVIDLVCRFDTLEENNSVTLLMIHEDLNEIGTHSIAVRQYLQIPEQPLALALHQYHAWWRVKEFLTSPQSHPDLFEPAVHWLLTLFGWRGFQLSADKKGTSELLEEDLGRQTRRSSDMMLISPQNKLVVLSLTSSLKDVPAKAQSIKNTANRLCEVLNCSVGFAVIVSDTVDVIRPTLKPVPVIGLAELNELWQQIEAGYVDRGNAILTNLLQG